MEAALQSNLALAIAFDQRPKGQQVASNLPDLGAGRVKALARFHMQQQDNLTRGDLLNNEVIRIRQWLFRQGARLTPEGKIKIWGRYPVSSAEK